MGNNLKLFRDLSGVTSKELATLLNVTTHTYIAFEQEKMSIPKVLEIIIAKIYSIPVDIICLEESKVLMENLNSISKMSLLSQGKRWELMVNRLFGQQVAVTYHTVSRLKKEILSTLVLEELGAKKESDE